MRYGIPDAYIEPMFTVHVSLFSYCSIWTPVLELQTLKTRYANVSFAYEMSYLLYINPLTPKDLYTSRTAPLTSKRFIYIFIQQM